MAKEITKKPSPGPKNLGLSRGSDHDGASIEARWGNPADALTETNHRWTTVDERWTFSASKNMSKAVKQQRGDAHVMADRVWVRDKGIHDNNVMWYNRSKYHPLTSGRYLRSVSADIYAINKKGTTHAKTTMTFKLPRKPTIPVPELDAESSEITFTVSTNEGADSRERYDTMIRVLRRDSANLNNRYKTQQVLRDWSATREVEHELAPIDMAAAMALLPGQWIRIRCQAYARGLAGNSEVVSRDYYYSYPAVATIKKIGVTSRKPTGIVRVLFSTNAKTTRPVDHIKMQRLADTTIGTASAASSSGDWVDVDGAEDDGNATGFSDSVSLANPSAKHHTWYRLVTRHGSLTCYSQPVEAKALYIAHESGGAIRFLSIESGEDGTSLKVALEWASDNYTTTVISWSRNGDSWESTEQPETFVIDWEDAVPQGTRDHSATITIMGLDDGVEYYVRARRMIEDDVTRYGPWCSPPKAYYPISTNAQPTEVTLDVPDGIARGKGIPCSWTVDGGTQTAWRIVMISTTVGRKVLASGTGPAAAATVRASKLVGMSEVTLLVSVSCGGDWLDSDSSTVVIAERPTFRVSTNGVLTRQPVHLGVFSSTTTAVADVAVLAETSVASDGPAGPMPQAEGDVIWSGEVDGPWRETSAQGEPYLCTVELPVDLDLRDGMTYRVTVTGTDTSSGLSSKEEAIMVPVRWLHQAVCPSDRSTVVVDPVALSATITAEAAEGAEETDVCDIYRVTPDGSHLVASDVPFGQSVTDPYAPFARQTGVELAYRLCTRTVDGDIDWRDVSYTLDGDYLRIDWAEGMVLLPYNLDITDSWAKDFDLAERWDGSRVGHWDAGATRRASLSTGFVWEDMADQAEALRALAQYAGPCFVRTPTGSAYQAHVEVTNVGDGHGTGIVAVTLDATEITLTDEYRIPHSQWGDVDA